MTYITEQEARKRKLPGCDVFKRSQLSYKDELNRDHFVVSLNRESLKLFNLSVTFGQHTQLKKESVEIKKQLNEGTFDFQKYRPSEQNRKLLEYMNIEFFYIATAFELHFKSWLIQNDYIVHIIDNIDPFKVLKKDQLNRPIHKSELFSLIDFQYNTVEKINILQGITEQSLGYSTICNKPNYISKLIVSNDIIGMVEDYRNLRNQIHLPGDICDTPNISRIGENASVLIINFINERIVENSNKLIEKNNFVYSPLLSI